MEKVGQFYSQEYNVFYVGRLLDCLMSLLCCTVAVIGQCSMGLAVIGCYL